MFTQTVPVHGLGCIICSYNAEAFNSYIINSDMPVI